MNAEEYIVERLKLLEKTNDSLKFLIDNQTERINILTEKLLAYEHLLEKAKLKFNDEGTYYSLEFNSYYSTLNDKGCDSIKSIIEDLKTLDLYQDIILEVEKREQNNE